MNEPDQDSPVDDGLVQNLHAMLANALRRTRPDPFKTPVTVAEIYQDLVPYRSVRVPLGFQMNADYEYTLLRLLAGEASLARLEPDTARDELRAELEAPNPNVGLFRKFAACDVWVEHSDLEIPEPVAPRIELEPVALPPVVEMASSPPLPGLDDVEMEPLPADPEPESLEIQLEAAWDVGEGDESWDEGVTELLLDEAIDAPEVVLEVAEAIPDIHEQTVPPVAGDNRDQRAAVMFESHASQPGSVAEPRQTGGACAFCRTSLPGGRVVRFCPHCGTDQTLKPCVSCNDALDPSWVFCISCGTKQA